MNNKQYNNVIENTLKHEQTEDSLSTARAIFDNMGVALPQGDMKTVYEIIKTDNYMGWKSCTMQEAQATANKGTAAIGISEDKIVVLSATDEEEPVTQTASVITLSENTAAFAVDGLQYYSYSYGTTTNDFPTNPGGSSTNPGGSSTNPGGSSTDSAYENSILDKPYDPNYPYTLNGYPNNMSEEQYYTLLNSYSYELRNDIVFDFTFAEIDSLRSYMVYSLYKNSTQQEREQVVEDVLSLAQEVISFLPDLLKKEWLGKILDAVNVNSTISSLNSDTVQDNIRDITDCIEAFSHNIEGKTSMPKPNAVTYKISLLKKSPLAGREIKIESSDGEKDIYTLKNGVYELALMTAIANAHGHTLYKVAPEWTYYWEG